MDTSGREYERFDKEKKVFSSAGSEFMDLGLRMEEFSTADLSSVN